MDALFTSTSAVCVTGLVTIVPAAQFTVVGKVVLLILIQIGGLGVIGCATAFFLLLKKRITLRERVVMQESYSMDGLGGVVGMVRKVILGTFVVEGVGALLYAFQFVPEYGLLRGVAYAVFHAVSAFCNAGIDILGADSLAGYAGNPLVNFTTMMLVVLSGIGFVVWYDVIGNVRRIYKKEVPKKWWFTRLKLHSKLAIVTTLVLLLVGALAVFLMEYSNPDTLGGMPLGDKVMASMFQSVTTRTAGFYTISQGALHEETKLVSSILMFIGGSPGGTAGGVKTTTIAMLFLTAVTVVKGNKDTECFGRRIPEENIRTGISVMLMSFTILMIGTIAVSVIESAGFLDILFETTSAIGTVGLSTGLTPALHTASKFVIMILMYAGRIGPVTMALAFGLKRNPMSQVRQLPAKRLMIG